MNFTLFNVETLKSKTFWGAVLTAAFAAAAGPLGLTPLEVTVGTHILAALTGVAAADALTTIKKQTSNTSNNDTK